MRVLLSGGTGLIGRAVLARLGRSHDIVTLGRGPGAMIRADLSDTGAIGVAAFQAVDAFVHCAGVVDEDFRDHPEQALRMALWGADAVVRRAIEAGARKLVYISSAHVYGPMVGAIDERVPVNPVSDYAIAHFATEQVFARHAIRDVASLVLRPCAVFGDLADNQAFRRWSLIPFSFPREAVCDSRIVIRSTGDQRRNFVACEDIAHQINHWLGNGARGHTVRNAIGATNDSIFGFAQLCARVTEAATGRACAIERLPTSTRTAGDDFDYGSCHAPAWPQVSIEAFVGRLVTQLVTKQKG